MKRYENFDVREVLDDLGADVRTERGDWVDCICLLHDERKPSFSINIETGQWICRHENIGGNVISLIQKVLKLDNREASAWLRNRVNIRRVESNDLFDKVMNIVKTKANYREVWDKRYKELPRGVMADYWFDRGFTAETMRTFGVRYDEEAREIIIPVFDELGDCLGYVARSLRGGGVPKYLNSGGFERTFFPLFAYAGDRVILVEGPFDALWLHQNGWREGLATFGAGLTKAHVKWLKANTRHVDLCFDNDAAGNAATLQALNQLNDMKVHILRLPNGYKDVQDLSPEQLKTTVNCI